MSRYRARRLGSRGLLCRLPQYCVRADDLGRSVGVEIPLAADDHHALDIRRLHQPFVNGRKISVVDDCDPGPGVTDDVIEKRAPVRRIGRRFDGPDVGDTAP